MDQPSWLGYAPRLLEGLLLSTSRVHDRDAVVATVRALGGECTDELTRRQGLRKRLSAICRTGGPPMGFYLGILTKWAPP